MLSGPVCVIFGAWKLQCAAHCVEKFAHFHMASGFYRIGYKTKNNTLLLFGESINKHYTKL